MDEPQARERNRSQHESTAGPKRESRRKEVGRDGEREKGGSIFPYCMRENLFYITNCYIFGVSITAVQFKLKLTQKLVIKNGELA